MPESSDPPTPSPQPDPAVPAKPADAVASARPRPRSNPPNAQQAQQAQQTQQTGAISLNDLVNLARSLSGEEQPPMPSAPSRTLMSRDQKKFSRQKSRPFGEPPDAPSADSSDSSSDQDESARSPSTAASASADFDDAASPLRKGVPASRNFARSSNSGGWQARRVHRSALLPFVLAQMAILALAFTVWMIFRAPREEPGTAQPVSSAPGGISAPVAPLSPRAAEMIDRLVEAEKAGDFRKALDLCEQVRRVERRVPGLDYRQAMLSAKAGEGPEVMVALNRSLAVNEEMVNSHNLIAALMLRQGKMTAAIREYEAAAQAGPFDDKPFFYWGEALRRVGRPQEALTRLDQAVDRTRDPSDEAFYRSKMRLTLIEMNRDREFAEELKGKLALDAPPADWLLTAAAVEMHRGKFDAAAGHLDRISKLVPPQVMDNWLRDYYLFGFAREKALERFYGPLLAPPSSSAPATEEAAPAASPSEASQGTMPGVQEMLSPVAPASLSAPTRAAGSPKPSASPTSPKGK